MRITCLVDNSVATSTHLWGEHGLAFYIETPAGNAMLDTGQSGTVLLHNMEAMGIRPEELDALAISHGHSDHSGGLSALLALTRSGLPLYANPDLFRRRYSKHGESYEDIGIPLSREALEARVSLHLDAGPQVLLPGIWTTGEIQPRPEVLGSSRRHWVSAGEAYQQDRYADDMALVVETEAGLVLLFGCGHAGLLNTLAHVQRLSDRPIVTIAGGTHLTSADDAHLEHVIAVLRELPALHSIYLNHCSGDHALYALRQAFGAERVRPCPAGTQFGAGGEP